MVGERREGGVNRGRDYFTGLKSRGCEIKTFEAQTRAYIGQPVKSHEAEVEAKMEKMGEEPTVWRCPQSFLEI